MAKDNDDKLAVYWEVICRVLDRSAPTKHGVLIHSHSGTGNTLQAAIVALKYKFDELRQICPLTDERREQERAHIMLDVNRSLAALTKLTDKEDHPDAEI